MLPLRKGGPHSPTPQSAREWARRILLLTAIARSRNWIETIVKDLAIDFGMLAEGKAGRVHARLLVPLAYLSPRDIVIDPFLGSDRHSSLRRRQGAPPMGSRWIPCISTSSFAATRARLDEQRPLPALEKPSKRSRRVGLKSRPETAPRALGAHRTVSASLDSNSD